MVELISSLFVLAVTLWGVGLVAAAITQQVPRYFRWTSRAIGWFIQTPFRVVYNALTAATVYLWQRWRRRDNVVSAGCGNRNMGAPKFLSAPIIKAPLRKRGVKK